jgi:hypothetical protein
VALKTANTCLVAQPKQAPHAALLASRTSRTESGGGSPSVGALHPRPFTADPETTLKHPETS